jgi:hypothetical protein
MGETSNAYRILVEKPEVERPLGTQRRRWVDNMRDRVGSYDWIELAQDGVQWTALLNTAMKLRVP